MFVSRVADYFGCIVYLLHAFAYCPHDPLICLCLAVASIGRAMQRQADNRHHLITQVRCFVYGGCPLTITCRLGRGFPHSLSRASYRRQS